MNESSNWMNCVAINSSRTLRNRFEWIDVLSCSMKEAKIRFTFPLFYFLFSLLLSWKLLIEILQCLSYCWSAYTVSVGLLHFSTFISLNLREAVIRHFICFTVSYSISFSQTITSFAKYLHTLALSQFIRYQMFSSENFCMCVCVR